MGANWGICKRTTSAWERWLFLLQEEKEVGNEMEELERKIIKNYNELLKTLLEEGDMDTLELVITDDNYREKLMNTLEVKLREQNEI